MKYKWFVKENHKVSRDLIEVAFNSEIIARLLLNREINSEEARPFLDPSYYKESLPEEIPDLIRAKNRILKAIEENEKIVIYGDYDVDGVTATSCLLFTLKQFTSNVDYYIPNRLKDGYGLNAKAVEAVKNKYKAKLLITCDCGMSNHNEIELANSFGIDVIVTDHHSIQDKPLLAYAVLNPKLLPENHKLHYLPGVGVVYKLCEAILEEKQRSGEAEKQRNKEDLLDLVALGMIADVVPLVGENRYLVQIGLSRLANTSRVGLKELLRICNLCPSTISTDHIGFGIAPRINAVGRLSDAVLAVRLFTTEELPEAIQIACELDIQNKQRQLICDQTLKEAIEMVKDQGSDKCIVLAKEGWHVGVLGIVASRLVEKFFLPTILIAVDKEQNIARGSGRSIDQLNIIETLTNCSSFLEKYGGHKAACGLSLSTDRLNDFILCFKQTINETIGDLNIEPSLKIDFELPLGELSLELVSNINKLAPFGLGNPIPIFVSDEIEVLSVRRIGKDNKHIKLILKSEAITNKVFFEGLIWNQDDNVQFNIGDKLKVAYTPKLNTYNGETFVQLEIKDWQLIETEKHISEECSEEEYSERRERRQTKSKHLSLNVCKQNKPKCLPSKKETEKHAFELFDFRSRVQECLELLKKAQVVYFAETEQKKFIPLKTFSRSKIVKAEVLSFLESPPDLITFIDIINKAEPRKIFLAFNYPLPLSPQFLLKRLIGMLKYAASNKDSVLCEVDLESALGINKSTLMYGLEILARAGFLTYERMKGELGLAYLSINISLPSRQNFKELIEYNLFVSELKKINTFKEWMYSAEISDMLDKLKQADIKGGIKLQTTQKRGT